jgi:hypothetical protein
METLASDLDVVESYSRNSKVRVLDASVCQRLGLRETPPRLLRIVNTTPLSTPHTSSMSSSYGTWGAESQGSAGNAHDGDKPGVVPGGDGAGEADAAKACIPGKI